MKKDITELYCCVEDFCRTVDDNFANMLLSKGRKPTRIPDFGNSHHNSYNAPICLDHFFQSDPIFKMNMLINTSTHI